MAFKIHSTSNSQNSFMSLMILTLAFLKSDMHTHTPLSLTKRKWNMIILKISKLIQKNNTLLTIFQDIKTENLLSVSLSLLYYTTKLKLK